MGPVGHLDYWTRAFPKGQTWPARLTGGEASDGGGGERGKEKHQEAYRSFNGFWGLSRPAHSLITRVCQVGFRVTFLGFPSATKSLHNRLRAFPVFPDASTGPAPSTTGRIKASPQVS